jgi:ABC-type methionine transport system permease subunit
MSDMKKTRLIPFLILVILLLPVAVSAVGNISVSSVPTGATIIQNGISTGLTTNSIIENVPRFIHDIVAEVRICGFFADRCSV